MKSASIVAIKNQDLNSKPMFYSSMAGNPIMDRLDHGVSIDEGALTVAKKISFPFQPTTSPEVQVIKHNLGYRPFVMGLLEVPGLKSFTQIGDDPNNGAAFIKDITENTVVIQYVLLNLEQRHIVHLYLHHNEII